MLDSTFATSEPLLIKTSGRRVSWVEAVRILLFLFIACFASHIYSNSVRRSPGTIQAYDFTKPCQMNDTPSSTILSESPVERSLDVSGRTTSEAATDRVRLGTNCKSKIAELDTGSRLTKSDWGDFDAKEVVRRAREGAAFKIMQRLQPFKSIDKREKRRNAPKLLLDKVFQYFFTQRKDKGIWRDVLKTQYFTWHLDALKRNKSLIEAYDSRSPETIIADLPTGEFTHRWLTAVSRGRTDDLLMLKRAGEAAGKHSLENAVGFETWKAAAEREREQVEQDMYNSENRGDRAGASSDDVPRRYEHQQQVVDLVEKHLNELQMPDSEAPPAPLHMIVSTPTGSGKTFTAVMLSLQLLQERFPGVILLYSVPTKQVLKRVGQDCEAHRLPYWTASQISNDQFQVRRPFSVRTDGRAASGSSTGAITEQLLQAHQLGTENRDIGGGLPSIIIADVFSASAILEAANANSDPYSPFGMNNFLLYFDEPNMGIDHSPKMQRAVHAIMQTAPRTAILTSATLPAWDKLDAELWHSGLGTTRITIHERPFTLPMAHLFVYDMKRAELRPVSVFELFENLTEFSEALEAREELSLLLLRHLSPEQAREVNGVHETTVEERWSRVKGDLKLARKSLEPQLRSLATDPTRFAKLKADGASASFAAMTPAPSLRYALSETGITLVATMNPRLVALELAGWSKHPTEDWSEAKRVVRTTYKNAERVHKNAEKRKEQEESRRSRMSTQQEEEGFGKAKKKKAKDEMPDEPETGFVTVGGVDVMLDENIDMDSLTMLSRGVAYTTGDGSEGPVVKRVYSEALLNAPTGKLNSDYGINVLVVDYSSIYGIDCPAVDRVVVMDDLGKLLTFEDHQQLIGRLRHDGSVVYLAEQTMRVAVAGLVDSRADCHDGDDNDLGAASQGTSHPGNVRVEDSGGGPKEMPVARPDRTQEHVLQKRNTKASNRQALKGKSYFAELESLHLNDESSFKSTDQLADKEAPRIERYSSLGDRQQRTPDAKPPGAQSFSRREASTVRAEPKSSSAEASDDGKHKKLLDLLKSKANAKNAKKPT